MPEGTCGATVRRDSWSRPDRCTHKAKGRLEDGTPACGVHLAAEQRRQLKEAERAEKEREKGVQRAEAEDLSDRFPGLRATPVVDPFDRNFAYRPGVVQVRVDALQQLLREAGR